MIAMGNIPHTIGIIMDGNRRYAKMHGLPTLEGHRRGYNKLRDVCVWAKEVGVKELIVFAFSTENWNRTVGEVGYLMNLFREAVGALLQEALREHMRVLFVGDRTRLAQDIVVAMEHVEQHTRTHDAFTFCIALSYGGRAEILDAVKRIPESERLTLTEESFSKLLWTHDLRDPDLIIRTSGEERLSNFLPWQSVYSELAFTKTLWPDFSKDELLSMIRNFQERERRRGK